MFHLYASRKVIPEEQLLSNRPPGALHHRYNTRCTSSFLCTVSAWTRPSVDSVELHSACLCDPLDVCLWGRLQPLVYSEPIHNLEALQAKSIRMIARRLEW